MEIFGITLTVGNFILALIAISLTSVIYDWLLLLAWRRKFKLVGEIPLPLFGNLLTVISKPMDKNEADTLTKYGPVYAASLGSIKGIHVADVNLLKKIFIKDHVKFQNRFTIDGFDPSPLDQGLLSLKDGHWKRVRNTITPVYSPGKIKMMTAEINYCADILTNGLIAKAKAGESTHSVKHFGCYSMDVIAGTAFGIRTDSYNNPGDPFVSHAQKVFGQSVMRNPLVIFAFFFPNVARYLTQYFGISLFYPLDSLGFFTDVITKIIEGRKTTGDTGRNDLLQEMLNAEFETGNKNDKDDDNQSGKKLSTNELLAQGFLVFIAGYETTASLLTFLSYVLATHPEVQDKLMEEIDDHVKWGDVVKYDVVMEMSYLDQVINETLRMYPPVLRMNRTTSSNQDVEVDGHWFPRDTMITYSIWEIHHKLGFYQEPELFKPERFSPEEKVKRDPFTFIPFGHGPRNCIGMRMALLEAKISVVHMLRKIRFVKCPETEEKLEIIQETFLRTKRPIKVGVELR